MQGLERLATRAIHVLYGSDHRRMAHCAFSELIVPDRKRVLSAICRDILVKSDLLSFSLLQLEAWNA